MNLHDGKYIIGKFLGIKTTEREINGQKQLNFFLGISYPKVGGYSGEQIVTDIQFSRQAVESGVHNSLDSFRGKQVAVPFYDSSRAYKDKSYTTYYFDQNRTIQTIQTKLEVPNATRPA